jgi:hypothetical protein
MLVEEIMLEPQIPVHRLVAVTAAMGAETVVGMETFAATASLGT